MTKRLDCPLEGCHARIEGETEDQIMGQAQQHAANVHPDLELDEETVEEIRSQIKTV